MVFSQEEQESVVAKCFSYVHGLRHKALPKCWQEKLATSSCFLLFDMHAHEFQASLLALETFLSYADHRPLDAVGCLLMPLKPEQSVLVLSKVLDHAGKIGISARQLCVESTFSGGARCQWCILLGAEDGGVGPTFCQP